MANKSNTRAEVVHAATLRAQHALLTQAQVERFGLSYSAVHSRIRRGLWERVLPGVFGICGVPLYDRRRLFAAYLYGGDGCALTGCSAATLWGLDGFNARPIEISITTRKCTGRLAFSDGVVVRVRRVDEYLFENVVCLEGLNVTDVPRTLLDLAGRKHPRAERALDQALRQGLTSLEEMSLFYEKAWLHGRRGVAILREFLTERLGIARTESDAEDLLVPLIRRGGFPPCERQYPVALPSADIRIDFAYPESRLAIECDSYSWHMDREAFARDRRRDAELQAEGWSVLRFTWHQLKFEPDYVIQQIAAHLRRPRER